MNNGGLNENQFKAVTSNSKYVLCIAGAGTGKTTVLTNHVAYLNYNRISCNNILCLTFTRLAGNEMKQRIIKLIGKKEGKKLFCNTFHSFCCKVLKEYGYKIGYKGEFTIYEEEDRSSIISNIIDDLFLKTNKDEIIKCLDKNLNANDYPELSEAIQGVQEYKYRLKANNAIDLDMLLKDTVWLLKHYPDVQQYYHNQYQYLMIDEFQDTNDKLMELIKILDPGHLFVVGDDAQTIYEWNGAEIKYILNFEQEHPGCDVIYLRENYRSTIPIIKAANMLIKNNTEQMPKDLITDTPGEKINYLEATTQENEVNLIISKILELGEPLKNYAVLSRTNKQLDIFIESFRKFNIKYNLISNKNDVLKKHDIKLIMSYIDAALNNKDNNTIKKIINFPVSLLTALDLSNYEIKAIEEERSLYETLKKYSRDSSLELKMNKFIKVLQDIENEYQTNADPLHIFKYVIQKLDLITIYKKQDRTNKVEDIIDTSEKMKTWMQRQEELGESSDMSEFLKWIKIRNIQDKIEERKDGVKLMTVHAAKGLEFPIVFLIGMNEGIFPSKLNQDIDAERRLAYVAITRAKKQLFVTRAKETVIWGNKIAECEPSRFINEMNII